MTWIHQNKNYYHFTSKTSSVNNKWSLNTLSTVNSVIYFFINWSFKINQWRNVENFSPGAQNVKKKSGHGTLLSEINSMTCMYIEKCLIQKINIKSLISLILLRFILSYFSFKTRYKRLSWNTSTCWIFQLQKIQTSADNW